MLNNLFTKNCVFQFFGAYQCGVTCVHNRPGSSVQNDEFSFIVGVIDFTAKEVNWAP